MRLRASVGLLLVLELTACSKKEDAAATAPAAPSASAAASAAPSAAKTIPAPPDVAAPPAEAEKTASGIASKVLKAGTGKDKPTAHDRVAVHYTGWTKDGTMFDSSVVQGPSVVFGLDEVIPGWSEAVQMMVVGEKRRFWIPSKLAYGDEGRGGAPKGDLTFDIELIEIKQMPKPPPVPEDVKAAPATAKKTASGLQYRVLKEGTGKEAPKAEDMVVVHYSGWTPDGKMFDSSVTRGEPATFPLNRVIKGWTEGVQLMKVGEKTRFWIPSALAYGDKPARPGAPAGPLVFDVELIEIKALKPAK